MLKFTSTANTGGRAALATKTLNDLGYKNAVSMNALIADWVKAGYPVVVPFLIPQPPFTKGGWGEF